MPKGAKDPHGMCFAFQLLLSPDGENWGVVATRNVADVDGSHGGRPMCALLKRSISRKTIVDNSLRTPANFILIIPRHVIRLRVALS